MGMFDNIKCKFPLPLTHSLLKDDKREWSEISFQTKNLENSLSSYYIDEQGFLFEEIVETEGVLYTEEELQTIKPQPWTIYKEIIETNRYTKQINHHGIISFYDVLSYSKEHDLWVNFKAYLIYGKVDKIELVEARLDKSLELYHKEYEEKARTKNKKLWPKIKHILSYFGWKWAWRRIAQLLYFLHQFLGKMQNLIYKNLL